MSQLNKEALKPLINRFIGFGGMREINCFDNPSSHAMEAYETLINAVDHNEHFDDALSYVRKSIPDFDY